MVAIIVSFFFLVFPLHGITLDQLAPYFPGQGMSTLKEGTTLNKTDLITLSRFYVLDGKRRLSLLVQSGGGNILDLYIHFPSSYLHNPLYKMLLARWGKASVYKTLENSARFEWSDPDKKIKIIYKAQCVFSCYPLSLSFQEDREKIPADIREIWTPLQ